MLFNMFIWIAGNPPRADKSAPTDARIRLLKLCRSLSHNHGLASFEYKRIVLVGVVYLKSDDIHRTSLGMARFGIDQPHYSCERIAGIDGCEILVIFFY